MNIFYLDNNLEKSTEYLMDKHCVKMILEHAQLLCTAKRLIDGVKINANGKQFYLIEDEELMVDNDSGKVIIANPICYMQTHINHPSSVWVRESLTNYKWLIEYTEFMLKEYTHRYKKIHKVESSGLLSYLKDNPPSIKDIGFTQFALAMPDDCKSDNAILSYRMYYTKYKQHLAKWKNRDIPFWYVID